MNWIHLAQEDMDEQSTLLYIVHEISGSKNAGNFLTG
jgi:hypothetical protein